jgi:hypothetical protein
MEEGAMTVLMRILALSICVLAASMSAKADEVWSSEYGDVIYETDIDGWAVWSFGPSGGGAGYGRIYIEGLAGIYSGRGSYSGYWMFYDSPETPCPAPRTDIEGRSSQNHGPFLITFLDPDFPSRWTAQWGACDGAADQPWNGTPRVGG